MRTTGAAPWLAALILFAAVVAVVLTTTPWDPFEGADVQVEVADPERDFTVEERDAARSYVGEVRPPAYAGLAVSVVLAVALGVTPLGGRLVVAAARPLGTGWVWQVLLGGLALLLVVRLATLPFSAWVESVRRDYGLSTRDWGGWLADVGRSFGLQVAGTLVAVTAMVALARALPRWWWAPAAGGAALLVVALSFAYPLVVEPLFNDFRPMDDGELRTSVVEMARAEGLEIDEVLVADASRRTTTLNAYVSGFGATHRVVMYDNLLEQAPDSEVRQVVAHEVGHTVENDVRDGTLVGALTVALGVCVLAGALSWRWLLDRAGADGAADPRVLGLVLAVVAVLGLAASPAENLISRRVETRADVHALELTRDPATFVQMQHRLGVTALSDTDPPPLVFGLFSSHPTKPQRIALARTWAELNSQPVPAGLAVAD